LRATILLRSRYIASSCGCVVDAVHVLYCGNGLMLVEIQVIGLEQPEGIIQRCRSSRLIAFAGLASQEEAVAQGPEGGPKSCCASP